MKEKKESHHTVKYRGLKERKRQKAIMKRRQKKHKSAKTQHEETRTITNDVLWFESPISQFFYRFYNTCRPLFCILYVFAGLWLHLPINDRSNSTK